MMLFRNEIKNLKESNNKLIKDKYILEEYNKKLMNQINKQNNWLLV